MAGASQAFAPGSAALRYFQAVARSGSFRRAAAEIRIAPSALSRQVRLLEEELGAELLERAPDGVRPTPAGEALLHRLGRAVQELDAARGEIAALQGAARGQVVIGANESVARDFLARFLVAFRAANPAISLRIVVAYTPELLARLADGEIDVVVAYGVASDAPVERLVAYDLVTCLMVHRQHRLARQRSVRLEDLLGETMILHDLGSQLARLIEPLLARASARPLSAITTSSTELAANLVALGQGVAVQNRLAPGSDLRWPEILYVPLAERRLAPMSLACCVRPGRPLPRATAVCARALGRALAEWSASVVRRPVGG